MQIGAVTCFVQDLLNDLNQPIKWVLTNESGGMLACVVMWCGVVLHMCAAVSTGQLIVQACIPTSPPEVLTATNHI